MTTLPKAMVRFSAILIKNSTTFFIKIEKISKNSHGTRKTLSNQRSMPVQTKEKIQLE